MNQNKTYCWDKEEWVYYGHKALREKCPNMEFFWSIFSCIRTEYKKRRTRKNSVFGHFSRNEE